MSLHGDIIIDVLSSVRGLGLGETANLEAARPLLSMSEESFWRSCTSLYSECGSGSIGACASERAIASPEW